MIYISNSVFESIKHIDENNNEYWRARVLSKVLNYNDWRNFLKIINKAKISCMNSNNNIDKHIVEFNNMLTIGNNAKRKVDDYKLSRYTCYLIAQNADSRKKVVALAQTYFAVQTRKQELLEIEYEKLSTQQIRKLISNISFEKMYIEYQKNIKEQYKSNEEIWIKYNQGSEEDAKKLSASLEGHNTGWCTAGESTAKDQLCGGNGYIGGDFYVYYTKNENNEYKIPRIAIRLDKSESIGEIRGVEEHQNLEEEMIPILESKLKEMTFLKERM